MLSPATRQPRRFILLILLRLRHYAAIIYAITSYFAIRHVIIVIIAMPLRCLAIRHTLPRLRYIIDSFDITIRHITPLRYRQATLCLMPYMPAAMMVH